MTRYLSADYVFPIHQEPIQNGVVAINDDQEVLGLYSGTDSAIQEKNIEKYSGIITPGFVNAHCHLELSHLYGQISKHTKLIPFLQQVMAFKPPERNVMEAAMQGADRQMYESGIVAVGDISNTINSRKVKLASKIHYHTFVEILGFDPKSAAVSLNKGSTLKQEFQPLSSSIVPHAPYSVSQDLFLAIQKLSDLNSNLFSIHNQESEEENHFYQKKEGEFIDFYKAMQREIDFFVPQASNSISSILPWLPQKERILFVHNTFTTQQDIALVKQYGLDATWCLCPNANLYIENSLPKVELFRQSNFPIVLGTDSLASNDKLCILSEIKTLYQYYPSLDLNETLKWATLNGAKFLGIENKIGSLEIGKRPGLNLISHVEDLKITTKSTIKKLI
jgi:cytosine/adenosine deaminase-related metal-dependent hydrolase